MTGNTRDLSLPLKVPVLASVEIIDICCRLGLWKSFV